VDKALRNTLRREDTAYRHFLEWLASTLAGEIGVLFSLRRFRPGSAGYGDGRDGGLLSGGGKI